MKCCHRLLFRLHIAASTSRLLLCELLSVSPSSGLGASLEGAGFGLGPTKFLDHKGLTMSTSTSAPSQQQHSLTHPSPTPSASLNPFADLIPSQKVAVLSKYTLESGVQLREVEVAYRTWGRLNNARDNVMVICHALTGSSDVEDW
jgi:hypothetical protein